MKKKANYDAEELEILDAHEAGTLKPAADAAAQRNAHRSAAAATFNKDQRLNIRISSRDLKNLQARSFVIWDTYKTYYLRSIFFTHHFKLLKLGNPSLLG